MLYANMLLYIYSLFFFFVGFLGWFFSFFFLIPSPLEQKIEVSDSKETCEREDLFFCCHQNSSLVLQSSGKNKAAHHFPRWSWVLPRTLVPYVSWAQKSFICSLPLFEDQQCYKNKLDICVCIHLYTTYKCI